MNMKENNIDFLKSLVINEESSTMLRYVFQKVVNMIPDEMLNLSTKDFIVYMYNETKWESLGDENKFSAKIIPTEEDVNRFVEDFKDDILYILNSEEYIENHEISSRELYSEILSDEKAFKRKLAVYALNSTIHEIKFTISSLFGPRCEGGPILSEEIQAN